MALVIVGGAIALLALGSLILRHRMSGGWTRVRLPRPRLNFSARHDLARGYGDRVRVSFDQMGSEVLILSVGVAFAVALGALIAV